MYEAGSASFGPVVSVQGDVSEDGISVEGVAVLVSPLEACNTLLNSEDIKGKVAIVYRGNCMFAEKVRCLCVCVCVCVLLLLLLLLLLCTHVV